MSGEFVDTNVLVYAHDSSAGRKREAAARLIERLADEREGLLSVQVLMEFYVTVTKRIPQPLGSARAVEIIRDFGSWPVFSPRTEDVIEAIRVKEREGLSFWDAMIVRAATVLRASILWSEDLADGHRYEDVLVRNPFSGSA